MWKLKIYFLTFYTNHIAKALPKLYIALAYKKACQIWPPRVAYKNKQKKTNKIKKNCMESMTMSQTFKLEW